MSRVFTVVGLNHATAPVEVREAVVLKPEEAGRNNALVKESCGLDGIVVLSTCSRFEFYACMDETGVEAAAAWFSRRAGRDLRSLLCVHKGPAAVRHLFRVASGLDSWVVGETEILGQVRSAYQAACAEKTANKPEHIAFQKALFVGKKVRNETRIVGGIASIGGAASVLARRIFTDLAKKSILVFGAGAMASSMARHLWSKGISGVWVANRSLANARALAAELQGVPMTLADGLTRLTDADIAVFSTGADRFLLDGAGAQELARGRGSRPLFLIDLAVPRNVDPEAAKAPGIYLYNIDDLRRVVSESLARSGENLARAEQIVHDECAECWERVSAPAHPAPVPVAD